MAEVREFTIFNSLTKQKESFKPLVPGKVSIYVCGVTAYDLSHIGHARAYVAFDVLVRYLKHLKYEVKYVRNSPMLMISLTKKNNILQIIIRANKSKEDPLALSDRFSREFLKDMDDLACLRPDKQPRVSQHMDQIIEMIKKKGIDLLPYCTKKVGNGVDTLFWDEAWLGDVKLKHIYPRVYALETNKLISVAKNLEHQSVIFSLRREPKGGTERGQEIELPSRIMNVSGVDTSKIMEIKGDNRIGENKVYVNVGKEMNESVLR
nr:cysteine--tRNA ligase 2, cytoplasmic-like [Tanacetum cinerariifolium]